MRPKILALSLFAALIAGCSGQNHSEFLTEKCVEDGMKLEGCECIITLMEENLGETDIRDLAEAMKNGDDSDSNFSRIDDEILRRLKAQMEDLPPLEKLKKGSEVGLGIANCSPKML